MSQPFIAQLMLVSFNFPPKGWAQANGQLLPINQNQALFSLVGTTYGGNGTQNFALPNLQGRTPVGVGNGISYGEVAGVESVTLLSTTVPPHSHTLNASGASASSARPAAGDLLAGQGSINFATATSLGPMSAATVSTVGGGQPHENRQPFLVMNWCIALTGIFPSRN
ncbi:MAG: tail fiber protein [Terracidiphilus sp.]|jgi:microcystin-dependent protein